MKKVLIINEGYSDNLGDQAINTSINLFFNEKNFDTSFMYLSNPEITKLPKYTYFSADNIYKKSIIKKIKSYILFFKWFYKFKNLIIKKITSEQYDIIVFGGGQLIISSGGLGLSSFSISLFWITLLIKKYSKSKIYMIGVGTSETFNFFEKKLYSFVFNNVSKIFVRDKFSQLILINQFKKEAEIIPDIAFYGNWTNNKTLTKTFLLGVVNYNEVFVRYNSKKNITKEQYFDSYYNIILEYEKKNMKIKLFYTTISDSLEVKNFIKYLQKKYNKEYEVCKIKNLKDLNFCLLNASIVYSGRMHALILAIKQGCQVKVQLISQKLVSFENFITKNKIDKYTLNDSIKKIIDII